jgi:hypothetical protein
MMNLPKVENMQSSSGNDIANQFLIKGVEYKGQIGCVFQSYASIIAFRPASGASIILDRNKWDYSTTTGKYRNIFLNEKKSETERKIKSGVYILDDLN